MDNNNNNNNAINNDNNENDNNNNDIKTICRHYARGYCALDDKCKFIHCLPGSDEYIQIFGDVDYIETKTKLCRHFTAGYCALNDQCKFIHSVRARLERFSKGSFANKNNDDGNNMHRYHQQQQQQQQQGQFNYNSIDMNASDNGQQQLLRNNNEGFFDQSGATVKHQSPKPKEDICSFFYKTGTCKYGNECRYLHQRNFPNNNISNNLQQNFYPNMIPYGAGGFGINQMNGMPFSSVSSNSYNNEIGNNGIIYQMRAEQQRYNLIPNFQHDSFGNQIYYPESNYMMHERYDRNYNNQQQNFPDPKNYQYQQMQNSYGLHHQYQSSHETNNEQNINEHSNMI